MTTGGTAGKLGAGAAGSRSTCSRYSHLSFSHCTPSVRTWLRGNAVLHSKGHGVGGFIPQPRRPDIWATLNGTLVYLVQNNPQRADTAYALGVWRIVLPTLSCIVDSPHARSIHGVRQCTDDTKFPPYMTIVPSANCPR
jgi:hypothetical protein